MHAIKQNCWDDILVQHIWTDSYLQIAKTVVPESKLHLLSLLRFHTSPVQGRISQPASERASLAKCHAMLIRDSSNAQTTTRSSKKKQKSGNIISYHITVISQLQGKSFLMHTINQLARFSTNLQIIILKVRNF